MSLARLGERERSQQQRNGRDEGGHQRARDDLDFVVIVRWFLPFSRGVWQASVRPPFRSMALRPRRSLVISKPPQPAGGEFLMMRVPAGHPCLRAAGSGARRYVWPSSADSLMRGLQSAGNGRALTCRGQAIGPVRGSDVISHVDGHRYEGGHLGSAQPVDLSATSRACPESARYSTTTEASRSTRSFTAASRSALRVCTMTSCPWWRRVSAAARPNPSAEPAMKTRAPVRFPRRGHGDGCRRARS